MVNNDASSQEERLRLRAETAVVIKRVDRDEVDLMRDVVSTYVKRDFARMYESITVLVDELAEPRLIDDVRFETQSLFIGISSERLEVSKRTVVVEDVLVARRTRAASQSVSVKLRREDIVVEEGSKA